MNNNHDIVNNSDDKDAITDVSARLLTENAYLRKLMGLMQENMELRITLKDHESKARSLSPQGQQRKDSKGKTGLTLSGCAPNQTMQWAHA